AGLADEIEIRIVAMGADEAGAGEQQQRVARPQDHVADLLAKPRAVAMNGDDRSVVDRAKVGLANATADQRAGRADDRLAKVGARGRVEDGRFVADGDEAARFL